LKKLLLILPAAFILCGCPFESNVPLESGPTEPVDSSLFGFWYGIVKDGSDFFGIEALDIKKESDSTYAIIRYGKAAKGDIILPDTTYYTAYTSYIGDQRFMNLEGSVVQVTTKGKKKEPEIKIQKVYYIASFEAKNDTLRVKTVNENFSTRKTYQNPADLKNVILTLTAQQKNIYDDLYSQAYRKIPKPAHF
jgi:hypothetical protein